MHVHYEISITSSTSIKCTFSTTLWTWTFLPEIDETSPIYSARCRHLLELSANEMRFAGEVLHAFKVARMRQNPPNQPPFALFSGKSRMPYILQGAAELRRPIRAPAQNPGHVFLVMIHYFLSTVQTAICEMV